MAVSIKLNGQKSNSVPVSVVLALPFTTLRAVGLDASLGLSAEKRAAIANLGYGKNAKTSIGFNGRPWSAAGCSGDITSPIQTLPAFVAYSVLQSALTIAVPIWFIVGRGTDLEVRPGRAGPRGKEKRRERNRGLFSGGSRRLPYIPAGSASTG